ncbi:MAG: radical SAM protein [Anaerolineales bacterium]|nr:radical SAM protein [Anaerolineales bacterium]
MKRRNAPLLLTSQRTTLTEGDCACSSSADTSLPTNMNMATLRLPADLIRQPLNDDFHVFLSPRGNYGASVLNREAIALLTEFDSCAKNPSRTAPAHFLKSFLAQGLLETDAPSLQRSNTLTAWLHVTDRCNLRCPYCYLPHLREDMSMPTAQAALRSVIRSALGRDFKRIKLKYAGGEPLLRFPFIRDLHEYAKLQAAQNGLSLDAVVLSNGVLLTDEIAQTLAASNIRLMISLDGIGNDHDVHRPYPNGRGSFREASAAIDRALSNGLTPHISVTVSAKTIDGLPQLVGWILQKDIPFNLNFYRESETSAAQADLPLDEEKTIAGLLKTFKVIESNLPRRNALSGMVDRANISAPRAYACGAGRDYLAFDQNGKVAPCQMLLQKTVADIHAPDALSVIQSDGTGFQNFPADEKEGCAACAWKRWCAGGCSLAAYRATGRYDVKSPYCKIYKAILPEAVRLEGLRVLKFGSNLLQ